MRSVSSQAAAAITSPERVIKHVVTVDWDGDGIQDIDDLSHHVGQIQCSQSLESSLPAPVRVVPGAAVAELDIELDKGNTFKYDVAVSYKSISTASSNSTTTITVPAPTGLQPGDMVILGLFNPLIQTNAMGVPRYTNVTWTQLAWRGDGDSTSKVVGMLLIRRVPEINAANPTGEPTSYTFTFGGRTAPFIGAAVRVGDAYNMGVADFSTKGQDDNTTAYTTVNGLPVKVKTPNSTIIGFWALQAPLVSGIGWSPRDNDVERADLGTTSLVGSDNIRVAVMTADGVAPGTYVKAADITGSSTVTAAVQFTVVLSPKLSGDEAQHAAWTYSELNTASTYASKTRTGRRTRWAVQVAGDNGFESVPIFTGLSIAAGADAGNRNAIVSALDNRELFRNPTLIALDLSGTVAESPVILDINGRVNLPGLESTWLVSYAFTSAQRSATVAIPDDLGDIVRNGFYASPPPLAGSCYAWIPCHGSMYPFIGSSWWAFTQVGGTTRRVRFVDGPYVAATEMLSNGGRMYMGWGQAGGAPATFTDTNSQFKGRIEGWVRFGATNGSADWIILDDLWSPLRSVRLFLAPNGFMTLTMTNPATTRVVNGPIVPNDTSWHFFGVYFDSVNTTSTFRIDTTDTVVTYAAITNSAQSVPFSWGTLDLNNSVQMADYYVHGGFSSGSGTPGVGPLLTSTDPWMNVGFTPTAFVDKSENILDSIPVIPDAEDVWTTLSNIATAEFAALYFDADGYPHYRTARSNVSTTGQTVQRTLTARAAIKELAYESGIAQVINYVAVGYTQFVAFVDQLAYQANGAVYLGAGQTMEINVLLTGPVLRLGAPTFNANTAADGTGVDITSAITVSISSDVYSVTATITNTYYFGAWFVNTSGQPSLTIEATWVGPSNATIVPEIATDTQSIRKYRTQSMTVETSVWRQRQDASASIARYLVSELSTPHPTVKNVSIVGDPRLELGDLTTLQDINNVGVNGNYRIVGKNTTSQNQLSQVLNVRQATTVARWGVNYWNDGTVWGVVSS